MTKIARRALMYATVSGCAQAPVVKDDDQKTPKKAKKKRPAFVAHDGGAAPKTKAKSK